MKRAHRLAGFGAGLLLAAGYAHADIMHWYWEVEVNGEARDTSAPVVVEVGDHVEIGLWGEFDPYEYGFGSSIFGIATGDAFFDAGVVSIDQAEGYGLNDALAALGWSGTPADTDGDATPDFIDWIEAFQLPPGFNSAFDGSNPIHVYTIGWELQSDPGQEIALHRAPTLDGILLSYVWVDPYGFSREYAEVNDTVRFIPAPAGIALAIPSFLLWQRRSRRGGRESR